MIYLQQLRHALIYTEFDGMVEKLSVTAFQNFFRIENLLNIKEVMSKTCLYILDISDIHSIRALRWIWSIFDISNML